MVRAARTLLAFAASAIAIPIVAQVPVTDTTTPRRFHLDATALRPGQFVYETSLERNSTTTVLGARTVTVARTTYNAAPAWLLLETRSGDGIPTTDSLLTDLTALHPLHWSSTQGLSRLAAEFRGDTVFGATAAPSSRRSIVAVVPSGTMVSSAMLETALRLLPLQTGWEDSTTALSITLSATGIIPTRFTVIGEDRVRVPAGTFDCWVVAVHADAARGLYWVTKRDPEIVRSALDVPALGGAQLVSALTRAVW
ncbi:MAG TPA: hypothetical protein VGQ56_16655 [Gemmatimonadaceae bacterium]|nr:hypothetical protein [Gemmatimonadaceae bacterium]